MTMALKLLYQVVILAFVSCHAQNITDQFDEAQTTNFPNLMTSENNTDRISDFLNETSDVPFADTVATDDVGLDEGDSGKADDLADYFRKKFGELISADIDEIDEQRVTSTPPSETELHNCSSPAVLDLYCEGVPLDVHVYFQLDMTIDGISAMILKPDIVKALQLNCTPGNWCLPDNFHQDVTKSKDSFYLESPFCTDEMWLCLNRMQDKRIDCGDEKLTFLVNTVLLLCDLEGLGGFGDECYSRTMEALYVTYADLTNPSGSQRTYLEQTDCNDFSVQMTKTYLCADDICPFDQNLRLEQFEMWASVAKSSADVAQNCNISQTCQSDYIDENSQDIYYAENDDTDNFDDEYDDDSEYYEDEMDKLEDEIKEEQEKIKESESKVEQANEKIESEEKENENAINADTNDGYDDKDRSMMLGLIVMTTALLLAFIGLALIVYRRFKRARNGNYKWGYSKLTTEDPRIVNSEYK